MKRSNHILTILGEPAVAADLCLRKVLRFKEYPGPVIILDLTGRGALLLDKNNKMSLERKKVSWIDLADKRKPVSLLHFPKSGFLKTAFNKILYFLRKISKIEISEETLSWAVNLAENLSGSGQVNLVALLKSVSTPEIRRLFLDSDSPPEDLGELIRLITWALRYPSIFACSESPNSLPLESYLKNKHLIWIEAKTENFETAEHQLLINFVETAVGNVIWNTPVEGITVIHLFPVSCDDKIPEWVTATRQKINHVSVHRFYPDRSLSPLQVSWSAQSDFLWVSGGFGKSIIENKHQEWLSNEEFTRISGLKPGDLWIRTNDTGKCMVVKIKNTQAPISFAHQYRIQSSRYRKIAPFIQLSTVIDGFIDIEKKNYTLFNALHNKDNLIQGWLKVYKNTGKDSMGIDGITTRTYKKDVEERLARLSFEIQTGVYQAKPFRQVTISKPDGGQRVINIACIRDRVVHSTCYALMESAFEPLFSKFSFAYRPHRNAHQAIAVARSHIRAGKKYAVVADIRKCFDNINHEYLLSLISRKIGDQRFLEFIKMLIAGEVIMFADLYPMLTGIPQGSSLSPFLCNIYLTPLDNYLESNGIDFVRYADDIVILSKDFNSAETALEKMKNFLMEPLLLELKPAKTQIVTLDQGFDFLGFSLKNDLIGIRETKLENVTNILKRLCFTLGDDKNPVQARNQALERYNAIVRGFCNYFRLQDESLIEEQLKLLDGKIEHLSYDLIPESVRITPAWICRQRFSYMEENLLNSSEDIKQVIGTGYPEIPSTSQESTPPHTEEIKAVAAPDKKKQTEPQDEEWNGNPDDMDSGLLEINDRLYVLAHGCYITHSGDEIVIKKYKKEIFHGAINKYSLIYLQGFGQSISVDLQTILAEENKTLVMAPPIGTPVTILNSLISKKTGLRIQQVIRRDDPEVISTGLKMLCAKVMNQSSVLKYFSKYRKKNNQDLSKHLLTAADKMREIGQGILSLDSSNSTVRFMAMGMEGHAASIYWTTVKKIIPLEFSFVKRVTKSAGDIINQCLNYAYGILYGEVWRAVAIAGLDPYFGLIHGSQKDQGSLVFDLIEEFRAPFVDRLMIGMMGRGFVPGKNKEGYLKTMVKKKIAIGFSKKWFKNMTWHSREITPARLLENQARSLADMFLGNKGYHAFRMRW